VLLAVCGPVAGRCSDEGRDVTLEDAADIPGLVFMQKWLAADVRP
jgi:hypothetical protein